jgi:hypothetical protein
LRAQLKEVTAGAAERENAVFSHLLVFFSRYYAEGDFISQRRYKGDAYAIPYAGEEVMLHWANKDQYYTKSGENFSNERGTNASFSRLAFVPCLHPSGSRFPARHAAAFCRAFSGS